MLHPAKTVSSSHAKPPFLRFTLCLVLLFPTALAAAKPAPTEWRRVATRDDVQRLYKWRDAFVAGLAAARGDGHGADMAREGALLTPDAALDDASIPPGLYRCRVFKLGAQGQGGLSYVAYPPFQCSVSGEGASRRFEKLTGSQRPLGRLFDADLRRKIFLGTLMLGDEHTPVDYGRDAERDMVGTIERIGAQRWRLVLPYPRFESLIDVVELVPAS